MGKQLFHHRGSLTALPILAYMMAVLPSLAYALSALPTLAYAMAALSSPAYMLSALPNLAYALAALPTLPILNNMMPTQLRPFRLNVVHSTDQYHHRDNEEGNGNIRTKWPLKQT